MIGGNTKAMLQHNTISKNAIGEKIKDDWINIVDIDGFIDHTGGDGSYKTNFKGKIKETTDVFICDYIDLKNKPTPQRLIVGNDNYEILLIDNPMGLNKHLEIYLKYNEVISDGSSI